MGYYHDHYLKKDVLLLADICLYFSFPGLSRDAIPKMTRIGLKKVFDIDMYLSIEKG